MELHPRSVKSVTLKLGDSDLQPLGIGSLWNLRSTIRCLYALYINYDFIVSRNNPLYCILFFSQISQIIYAGRETCLLS